MEMKKRKHEEAAAASELLQGREEGGVLASTTRETFPFMDSHPFHSPHGGAIDLSDPGDHPLSKKHILRSKLQRQRSECIQNHLHGLGAADEEYQRIIITETSEDTEEDTIYSCQTLHKCMSLRKKWISDLDAVTVTNKEGLLLPPALACIVEEEMNDLPPVSYQNILHREPSVATKAYTSHMVEGVTHVFDVTSAQRIFAVPSFSDFVKDYLTVSPSLPRLSLPLSLSLPLLPVPSPALRSERASTRVLSDPIHKSICSFFILFTTSTRS
jgi:hypothetical protein